MSIAPEPSRPLSPAAKAMHFVRLLLRPALARKLGTLVTEGYLARTGWVRSVQTGKVVGEDQQALPWLTYPCVDFLAPRLGADWQVFEFGAGASTLFFSQRVRAVTSVEHDENFATSLRGKLPAHARLLVRPAGSETYAGALLECPQPPDLVLVDGVDRPQCLDVALQCLPAKAVLVLDDAEREEYSESIGRLKKAGYRGLEFWGLAPGVVASKCTMVFYRTENVLGL
jgi:hypothetical protein